MPWSYGSLKYLSSFCIITGFMVICCHGLQISSKCCFSAKNPKGGTKNRRIYFSSLKFKAGVTTLWLMHHEGCYTLSALTELIPQREKKL